LIVTGGAHGIGRACGARLAEEGAQIAVADLDQSAAEQVATSLTAREQSHAAVWLDVTDEPSVERAFADAASRLGGIDVVINVAGGDTHHGRFEETSDDVWVQMIELNLLGAVRCCRRSDSVPAEQRQKSRDRQCQLHQRPRGSGQRTLLVREGGNRRPHDQPCSQFGCRWHQSEHGRASHDQDPKLGKQEGGADSMRHLYPLGRVGEPEDVAAAVAFLASSDAAWITGHTLPVDGGLMTGARTT
jgi:NAD(P)-dependent dehydrogenase (short-subunit alcohol dehydrogenase family)